MPRSFFIWNGIDCRSMGIHLSGPAPIVRPEERVKHVQIPGRAGDLTQLEGEEVYNSYIQTATIHVKGGYRVREVHNWLKGEGYVTFSGEPDRRQKARIIGAITLNKASRNLDIYVGEVQFYCQPLKELLRPETVTISSSGATVRNNGDVASRPRITVNATDAGQVITIGGFTVDLTGMADTGCIIDCDAQAVTNYAGAVDLTHKCTGDFPMLAAGDNTVTFTNVSSLVIDKRERYL